MSEEHSQGLEEDLDLDYDRDTTIDVTALDVEWVQQSDLVRRYSKYAAQTKRYMDQLKERLEVTKAQLEREIRKNPKKYDIDKVTESAVQAAILAQPEYQIQMNEYREARYENDIAQGAVRALDHKKTALENLVRLLGQNYFSGPVAPRDLSKEWAERAERRNHNARVRIRRRNKDNEDKDQEQE